MIVFPRFGQPRVSIVIVGWRDAPRLIDCLASVASSVADTSYEVILALNEPTPELAVRLHAQVAGASIYRFDANLGYAGAANAAAASASGEFVALLNDDCVAEVGWLEQLLDLLRRRPRCGIVGSTFVDPDGSLQEAGSIVWCDGSTWAIGGDRGGEDVWFEHQVDYCSAASILVRRAAWQATGGFDERYFPAYYEDVDLALRAQELGWECWYQPRSVVRHARSSSTSAQYRSFISDRSYTTFVERWREKLTERRRPGAIGDALWDAMGRPLRILLVTEDMPAQVAGRSGELYVALETLGARSLVHPAVHATRGSYVRQIDGLPEVRVIADLRRHLTFEPMDYEVALIDTVTDRVLYGPLISHLLPRVTTVGDISALFATCAELSVRGT